MPRFKPKAMLERSATADLFKNTLSRIPTVFGRLAYLASLRDPVSGIYRHHGLGAIFGREESRKALHESHWNVFRDWLTLPLEQKTGDLQAYLNGLDEPSAVVLGHWSNTQICRTFMPTAVRKAEEQLFMQEFDVLLEVLECPPKKRSLSA